ncbi:MAG TPA: TetR/AcrR family transcriptional regulator [Gemmatimonadaceae bacterium]|nr:TetR/AcrR family transcriptional regulator [Gemmatimonadaceae bacterium]
MSSKSAAPATAKSPKWRRRPEHRPQQIIAAALEAFGECGLAKATLDDIAKRAGVSKGTIYLYFPNKEELFREVVRQTAVAAIESGERTVTQGTPSEQLFAAMRGYWAFVRSPIFNTLHRLVLGELHQFPDLARFYADEVVARGLKLLSGIIRRGIDAGEFRNVDPIVAARMLVAMTVMNAIWRDEQTGVPLLCHKKDEEVFRELAQFYLHSVTATNAACDQADGAPAVSFFPFDND